MKEMAALMNDLKRDHLPSLSDDKMYFNVTDNTYYFKSCTD